MKNLIIHPKDSSTTFLKPIYKEATNKNIIEDNIDPDQITSLIKTSDRIMIMGHGSPNGLFSINMFQLTQSNNMKSYAIDKNESEILKTSDQNIYIWCNANMFVEEHDLKGFYSGMFVSEMTETMYCNIRGATQGMVDESNDRFSEIVGKYINLPVAELYEKVMEEYGELAKTNPVAKYNHERLYIR